MSAPPLHRGGKPELKIFSYHRWSRYRSCGKRVTDSSQAVIISFVPTSFKSPHYLRPMRARDTAYFESYATDVFITPCLSPFSVEGCWQGENSVALINVAINFVYEYFSFVIYFSKIFFIKTIFQHFFPIIFFSTFFFSKHLFKICFLRVLLSMLSRLQRQNALYVSVL